MSAFYLRRVMRRFGQLIASRRQLLPDEEFGIGEPIVEKHGTKIVIPILVRNTRGHWVCDEPLTRIVDELNSEFEHDRHYDGIELEVPGDWADGFGEHFVAAGCYGETWRIRRSTNG